MHKFLAVLYFTFCALFPNAQTKVWNGAGDGSSWNDGANWSPAGVPGPPDIVLLDNSFVINSYQVFLPGGAASVLITSLTITPSGANNITLRLPGTNTANPAFTATGAGDAVVLNDGAIFINASGRTSAMGGTPVTVTATNFVRINNGGRYIHKTPVGHTTNWARRLSTVAGTQNGIFEFDVPAVLPVVYPISSVSGQYGTLIIAADSAGGTRKYSSNGGAENVKGDMIVKSGVTYSYGPTAAGTNFNVAGSLNVFPGAIFDLSTNTNTMNLNVGKNLTVDGNITETGTSVSSVIILNGSANQNVSVQGGITNTVNFRINNAAGATLTSPVLLPYNLQLTLGKIKTDATNILTMIDNATYTGGSVTSFIEGPMKKGGDEDFIYPVGKGTIYTPVGLTGGTGAVSDTFSVEYIRNNPQNTYGTNYEVLAPPDNIDHISYVEYWMINRTAGAATKYVALPVNCESFCKNFNTLFVTRYDNVSTQWKNLLYTNRNPVATTCSPYLIGTITAGIVNNFSPFTVATSEPFADNPLPLTLISFDAVKINNGKAQLSWEMADYLSSDVKFEIQSSHDRRNFTSFNVVEGSGIDRSYSVDDHELKSGVTYYRLKMINENVKITYSSTVAIFNSPTGFIITAVYPNPVRDDARVTLTSALASKIDFVIYDAAGIMIKKWRNFVGRGNNNIPVQTNILKPGIYLLLADNGEMRCVLRFVKK